MHTRTAIHRYSLGGVTSRRRGIEIEYECLLVYFIIADSNSLDFIVNRLFVKLFKTSNIDTVNNTVVGLQSFSLNFRALFSNNVVGNFLRNVVHVKMSFVNLFIQLCFLYF